MSEPDRSHVVLTNVPDQERGFAREHLGGTNIERAELSQKLARKHADADILSLMIHDPVDVDTLEIFEGLDAIVTRSDGYDHLPRDWMEANDVQGFHLHDYATESVAHHALAFILASIRRMPEGMAMTLGEDPDWDRSSLMNRHLQDVTVGVLGTGKIGSRVVEILSTFGARVRGHDIDPDSTLEQRPGFAYADGLEDLLTESDVLTVHVPLDETTEGMISERELARLSEGAILVNTARGEIVDQQAVADALEQGRLGGYAADVLPDEPDPPELATFQGHERVILTPHLAAYDERTTNARYEYTARIIDAIQEQDEKTLERFRVI